MTTVIIVAVLAILASGVIAVHSPPSTSSAEVSVAARGRALRCFGRVPNLHDSTNGDDFLLLGRVGRDVIHAKKGNDRAAGLSGGDSLCGGRGDDSLDGGDGFDRISGGPGYDICTKGERVKGCEQFFLSHAARVELQRLTD